MGGRADLDHYRKGELRVKISGLLAHATLKRQSRIKVRATVLHTGDLSWGSRTNTGLTHYYHQVWPTPGVTRSPCLQVPPGGVRSGFRGGMEGEDGFSTPTSGVLEEVGA